MVYGGSDVPEHRRIRSGLACNPTFLRLFAGDAVLDAVRLSRGFFDLGPFRAADMERPADNRYRLTETLTAAYYQPLPKDERRDDGVYRLVDDGRFSASMAFPDRPRDEVSHTTRVEVDLREDGADLRIDISGPRVPWALELTFRPGGVPEGAVPIGDGRWCLTTGPMTYRVGDDEIRVEAASRQANRSPGRTAATYCATTRVRTTRWWAAPTRRPATASTSVDTARTP